MKKFTIYKGSHMSHIFPKFYKNKPLLNFDFMFTSNCVYDLSGPHNMDCNKLFGLSFGLIHNTTTLWGKLFKKFANSFRLGWNCSTQNRKIQLQAYYYNDGVRKIEYITDVSLNKVYNCCLYFDRIDNKVYCDIRTDNFNLHTSYDFRFKNCPRWGLFLWFFFGGRISAPHKMSCYIKRLN